MPLCLEGYLYCTMRWYTCFMKKSFIEAFGWYGTLAIVAAYALSSFSIISSQSLLYQILNGTGAIGIVLVSFHKKAYQPGILNVIWAVIAFITILNIVK